MKIKIKLFKNKNEQNNCKVAETSLNFVVVLD